MGRDSNSKGGRRSKPMKTDFEIMEDRLVDAGRHWLSVERRMKAFLVCLCLLHLYSWWTTVDHFTR